MTPQFQQLINDVKAYSPPDNRGALGEPLDIKVNENIYYESATLYYPIGIVSIVRFLDSAPVYAGKQLVHCVMNEWRKNSINKAFSTF